MCGRTGTFSPRPEELWMASRACEWHQPLRASRSGSKSLISFNFNQIISLLIFLPTCARACLCFLSTSTDLVHVCSWNFSSRSTKSATVHRCGRHLRGRKGDLGFTDMIFGYLWDLPALYPWICEFVLWNDVECPCWRLGGWPSNRGHCLQGVCKCFTTVRSSNKQRRVNMFGRGEERGRKRQGDIAQHIVAW